MDLTQIRYFLALARTLNFTRAAEGCNVTQPALTKSIKRLEEELGGPLILRERALTQLTDLGRTMLPLLEEAYAAAERAKERAATLRRPTTSPLRLGFTPDTPAALFMPLFAQLAARLTSFELTMLVGTTEELCEALLQGTLDAAAVDGGEALPERLNRWRMFDDAATVLMRPDHPLAATDAVQGEALTGTALIGRASGVAARLAGGGIRPSAWHRVDRVEDAISLVRTGIGLAVTTERRSTPSDLVARPFARRIGHDVLLVAVAGRPISRAADVFLKLARARDWGESVQSRLPVSS